MAGSSPGMTSWRAAALPIPPIDRRHRELRQLNAVDAAHIERNHVRAIRLGAAREHVDTAIIAELVADGVLVEQIFLQILLAGAQLKALRRHEGEVQALLGADRAVARSHHGEIRGALEADHAAMATAGECPRVGHASLSFRLT